MPARRELAEQHLRARVGALDRRPRGAHEAAVDVRRGGDADAPRHAGLLRLEPARDVRLVPDQVAVDAVAVARRHGARELREQRRVRLVARVVQRGLRLVHSGPGPVTLSITRIPAARVRSIARSSVSQSVAARAVVAGVEAAGAVHARLAPARRRSSARGCARRRRRRPPSRRPRSCACAGSESSSRSSSIPTSRFEAAAAEATGPARTSRSAQARTARARPRGHRGATRASREVSAPHCRRHTPARFGTRVRNWPLRERTVSVVTVVNAPAAGRPVLDLHDLRRRVRRPGAPGRRRAGASRGR